jgi:hypothetical protein
MDEAESTNELWAEVIADLESKPTSGQQTPISTWIYSRIKANVFAGS